jgi:hypothetical protein
MIELTLKIKYTKPDGYTAWLETEREGRVLHTPLRGFHRTPTEAAKRAVLDLPVFLKRLGEAKNVHA